MDRARARQLSAAMFCETKECCLSPISVDFIVAQLFIAFRFVSGTLNVPTWIFCLQLDQFYLLEFEKLLK